MLLRRPLAAANPLRLPFAVMIDEDPPRAFMLFDFDGHASSSFSVGLNFPYCQKPERQQLSGVVLLSLPPDVALCLPHKLFEFDRRGF